MTNWEVIKELGRQAGLYRRKALFIVILAIIGLGINFWWQRTTIADIEPQSKIPIGSIYSDRMEIEITKDAQVFVDGKKNNQVLKFYENYDELLVIVFDSPGEYISHFKAEVTLPRDVTDKEKQQIRQRIYAVHGVGSNNSYMRDSKTLVYEASNISPQATLTIVAHLPKDLVSLSFFQKIKFDLQELPLGIWLYTAIILPFLTIIMMAFMLYKRHSEQIFHVGDMVDQPPSKAPPAVVGVLVDGTIGAREIAATLIDLARRGYLNILHKGEQEFSFVIRHGGHLEDLKEITPFEKSLLSKIFLPKSYRSSVDDIEMRIGRHIFSRKIAKFYLEVYNLATMAGYFIKNPAKVHLAYKYVGIVLFFLSFVSFLLNAVVGADPKFSLVFWVGGMVAAVVIIRLAPFMPARSIKGSQELRKWLAFRKYFVSKKTLTAKAVLQNKFEEFLPYAIVMGVEVEWARRFGREPFIKPDWYESTGRVVTLETFSGQLFPLIGYVAKNLARSHEPTVE